MKSNRSGIGWMERICLWCRIFQKTSRRQSVLHAARQGDFSPLLQDAETALNNSLWHLGSDHPETARKLAAMAAVHGLRSEIAEAQPLLRRAITILEQSRNESDQAEARALREQLAELSRTQGDYKSAEKIYSDLLFAYQKTNNTVAHTDTARTLDNLALTLKEQGQITAAKERHRDALLVWEQVCGPGSPEVARCLTHLASLYLSEHRYDEAEPLLLRAVAEWKSSPNPHDLYAIITLSCCGDLYRSTGRGDEARVAEDAAKAVLARYAK